LVVGRRVSTMMSKLLDFLFSQSQEGEGSILDSNTFGADLIHLFEEANKEEGDKLKVSKQPLAKALSTLGITGAGNDLELDPRGFSLICGGSSEYRDYLQLLSDPDSMAKLAGLGWVHSAQGDVAMHNEPAEFRIRFLEIDVAGEDDEGKELDKVPSKDETNKALNAILTKGREFATTPVAVDDPSGDVDREEPDSDTSEEDGRREGIGKEKDGSDPEGKVKGAEKGKRPEAVAKAQGKVGYKKESLEEGKHKSGCTCGFCKNKGNIGNFKRNVKNGKDDPEEEQKDEKQFRKDKSTSSEDEDVRDELEMKEERIHDLITRILEDSDPEEVERITQPSESVDDEKLERGRVEKTHLFGGKYGKNVDPKGKTSGKFKFPSNWKVGYAGK